MTDSSRPLRDEFLQSGFVIQPSLLSETELAPALASLPQVFPTPDEFHDDVDAARNERYRSEFGGISEFPFSSVELSLIAVHDRLIDLASILLTSDELRIYAAEAWAKYTGAAKYDQHHHRDYLNHSLLVPSPDDPPAQVEMFVYLNDVTTDLGPPAYVPRPDAAGLSALPNWYPRHTGESDPEHPNWVSPRAHPDLYDHEVSAAGPLGTVVAYRIDTFHRGTELRRLHGARFTIHVNFRCRDAEWITRRAWTDRANTTDWATFIARASPRQLQLFGFPPPGHPYWNETTLTDVGRRYPGFDPTPWR